MLRSLADLDPCDLRELLSAWGLPTVHARAILRGFYHDADGALPSPDDIGRALRRRLEESFVPLRSRIALRTTAGDGTRKLLVEFPAEGGRPDAVESVLMPAFHGVAAAGCVSSQVGCAMGCDFCASTRGGLVRDLSAGEIVEQFLHLRREAASMGRRLRTLVFMGMGEPLHNLDAVLAAVRRIAAPDAGALGWRQITISTVGIVPGIDRLADADLNVHLAVSLHAPDDATRARLVPAGRRYGVGEVMAAARRFYERTRRIVTIEYCLLDGVNDSMEQAQSLAALMEGFRAHVNLIPYNAIGAGVSGAEYRRPPRQRMETFLGILRGASVVAHFRATRGEETDAACGQLRERSGLARLAVASQV